MKNHLFRGWSADGKQELGTRFGMPDDYRGEFWGVRLWEGKRKSRGIFFSYLFHVSKVTLACEINLLLALQPCDAIRIFKQLNYFIN